MMLIMISMLLCIYYMLYDIIVCYIVIIATVRRTRKCVRGGKEFHAMFNGCQTRETEG